MSADIQKTLCMDDELRTSCKLIKLGLGELQCIDLGNDFYHLPLQLISSGLERFMKCYFCLVHEAREGCFPDHNFLRNKFSHDLLKLKDEITNNYFNCLLCE